MLTVAVPAHAAVARYPSHPHLTINRHPGKVEASSGRDLSSNDRSTELTVHHERAVCRREHIPVGRACSDAVPDDVVYNAARLPNSVRVASMIGLYSISSLINDTTWQHITLYKPFHFHDTVNANANTRKPAREQASENRPRWSAWKWYRPCSLASSYKEAEEIKCGQDHPLMIGTHAHEVRKAMLISNDKPGDRLGRDEVLNILGVSY